MSGPEGLADRLRPDDRAQIAKLRSDLSALAQRLGADEHADTIFSEELAAHRAIAVALNTDVRTLQGDMRAVQADAQQLRKLLEAFASQAELLCAIKCLEEAVKTGFACLERKVTTIATQLEEMDAKLVVISDTETMLGQSIQKVVDYLKSNPNPTDLSAQLGVLENISGRLISSNANTLAHLPPTPEPIPDPVPSGRR